MPFKKGESGNLNGRPKGTKNKDLQDLRTRISMLLSDNYNQVVKDLSALTPNERINAFIKLLEYALPKLTRTEIETPPPEPEPPLTPEEIQEVIRCLKEDY